MQAMQRRVARRRKWELVEKDSSGIAKYIESSFSVSNSGYACEFCGRVTRTAMGLRRHFYSCRGVPIRLIGILLDASRASRRRSSLHKKAANSSQIGLERLLAPAHEPSEQTNEDFLTCKICLAQVKPKNLKRHLRRAHGRGQRFRSRNIQHTKSSKHGPESTNKNTPLARYMASIKRASKITAHFVQGGRPDSNPRRH